MSKRSKFQKHEGGRPAYEKGSLARDIMDVLRDAPRGLVRRALKLAVEKRRREEVASSSLSQALRRMVEKGDVERYGEASYRLIAEPIPERYENAAAWADAQVDYEPEVA